MNIKQLLSIITLFVSSAALCMEAPDKVSDKALNAPLPSLRSLENLTSNSSQETRSTPAPTQAATTSPSAAANHTPSASPTTSAPQPPAPASIGATLATAGGKILEQALTQVLVKYTVAGFDYGIGKTASHIEYKYNPYKQQEDDLRRTKKIYEDHKALFIECEQTEGKQNCEFEREKLKLARRKHIAALERAESSLAG